MISGQRENTPPQERKNKKNPQALSLISHSRKLSPLDMPALLECSLQPGGSTLHAHSLAELKDALDN